MASSSILYDKIGISQQVLAAFIGAKQSTLSHHDNETRDLPSTPSIALNNLVILALNMKDAALPTCTASDKKELLKAANSCKTQCYPLQKKLDKMRLAQQQAANMPVFVETYKKTNLAISDKIADYLNIINDDATFKLEKNSWLAIKKLEIEIQTLQHQAALYEAASEV